MTFDTGSMGDKGRILLVDDKPENLRLLVKILSTHYVVHPATSGEGALRFLKASLPDLILLDIMMPNMDGYQVCHQLKASERTRDIPVIFISAEGQIVSKAKAFAHGGVDYITKPFQLEEVLLRVQAHLSIRDQQKRLEAKVHESSAEVAQVKAQLDREITEHKQAQERLAGLEGRINLKPIESKFNPPQVSDQIISVSRIETKFDAACAHRLTILTAPAGYGKSTTMAKLRAFLQAKKVPVGWVSLDEEDNEPQHFLQYLLSALQRAKAHLDRDATDKVHVAPTVEAALGALIHDLETVGGDVVFFLDDYHVIHHQAVHDIMDRLIEQTPRGTRFVIASRSQPPLSLTKLRLVGNLFMIEALDLGMGLEEAAPFIEAISGLSLGGAQLKHLCDITEGWPAGLQFAALALKGGGDVDELIREFSGRDKDVTAYIGEMVLSHLPQKIVEFLHFAALFDRFSVELCRDLFSAKESVQLIEQVRAENLFLISLDRENRWYRFHQLFGDYLKNRVIHQHVDDLQATYRKASVWFERQDLVPEAIRYALAGGDHVKAADLLATSASKLARERGEHAVLLDWVEKLPSAYVDERPDIKLAYLWSLMFTHRFDDAESALLSLERSVDCGAFERNAADAIDAREARDTLCRKVELIRCIFHILTDRCDLAEPLCTAWLAKWTPTDPVDTATAKNGLGYCLYINRNHDLANRHIRAAKAGFDSTNSFYGRAWAETCLAIVALEQGEIAEADRILTHALKAKSISLGTRSYGGSMLALLHAQVCYEQNRLEEAECLLDEAFAFAQRHGIVETILAAYRTRSRLLALKGDIDLADHCLTEGVDVADMAKLPRLSLLLELERVYLYLRSDQTNRAAGVAVALGLTDSGAISDPRAKFFHDDIAFRTLAIRLQFATGKTRQLPLPLNSLLIEARRQARSVWVVKLLCLRAVWQVGYESRDEALRSLDEALTIGAACNLLRVFEDESNVVTGLLREIADRRLSLKAGGIHEASRAYLLQVIAVLDRQFERDRQDSPVVSSVLQSVRSEEFSEREIQVLTLLATGLANRDLAAQLFLSEATIKWHLHNIYAKLNVSNRSGAIARARQLFLLK